MHITQGVAIHCIQSRYVGPTTNSVYLNDHCLSPFDCVGLMDVVAENGGWGTGTLSALGYLMGVGGIDVVRII